MKTTVVTLALLAIAATAAMAQVPRTINYQGRAADATAPVTGNQTMTLKLYTTATGGAAIFTETQTVEFKEGIFTVAVGGATPGGIPASITFDQQYWLGVTISSFNGGNELAPRFILRSSPYSFRTQIADSAVVARSANEATTLRLPATLESSTADPATLKVVNANGTAILAQGDSYAIVSDGIDSTANHYVAGEVHGTLTAPSPGSIYRDNAPIAWGVVQPDGNIVSDFGIESILKPGDQGYEITLDNPVHLATYGTFVVPEVAPVITIGGTLPPSTDIQRVFITWNFKRDPTGALNPKIIVVRFVDIQGSVVQLPFSIVVFGRPQ